MCIRDRPGEECQGRCHTGSSPQTRARPVLRKRTAQSRNSGHRYVGSLDTAPLNLAALRPVTRQLSSSKIREETCTRLRRGRVLTACTGAAFSRRPLARIVPRGHAPRIENPGTGPRTSASGSMSTSEASVSPAGSVGPERSPLGTRTQRCESPRAATRRDLTEMQPPPRTCASGSMSTSEAKMCIRDSLSSP